MPWGRRVPEGTGNSCSVLYLINTRMMNSNPLHMAWDDLWYLGGKSSPTDMGGIVGGGMDMGHRCPPHTLCRSCFWTP